MTSSIFNDAAKAAAKELGFSRPMFLFVHDQSPQARTVKDELARGAFPAKRWPAPLISSSVFLTDEPHAAALLRKHLGKAGAAVAERLENDSASYDHRHVAVLPYRIEAFGYRNGEEILLAVADYQAKPDQQDRPDAGSPTVTQLAIGLAGLVANGMPHEPGRPLDDDALAACLHAVFIDKPWAVAHAITVLRRHKEDGHRQLLRVLERPELAFLKRDVDKELALLSSPQEDQTPKQDVSP